MTSINTAIREPLGDTRRAIGALPAQQQPIWGDDDARDEAISSLERSAPLVLESEIAELKDRLRAAWNGNAFLLQAGDCVRATREFNETLAKHPRLSAIVLPPIRERIDGLAIACVLEN